MPGKPTALALRLGGFNRRRSLRGKLEVPADITEEAALEAALADEAVQRSLAGREVVKVIARLPKMLSLVPGK